MYTFSMDGCYTKHTYKSYHQAWEAHPALFRKALAGLVEQYAGNRTVVVNPAVDWVLAGGLGSAVRGTSTQKRCMVLFGLGGCMFVGVMEGLTVYTHGKQAG